MHAACMMERPVLEQSNSKDVKSKVNKNYIYIDNAFVKVCMLAQAQPSIMASVAHKAIAYLHKLYMHWSPHDMQETYARNSSEIYICTHACKEQAVNIFFCHSKVLLTGLALRPRCRVSSHLVAGCPPSSK